MKRIMRNLYTAFLCVSLYLASSSLPALAQQAADGDQPFTLETTGNLVPEHSTSWDFSNQSAIVKPAGVMVVVGTRKKNISDHEIEKNSDGNAYWGCNFEVRDESGRMVAGKSFDQIHLSSANTSGVVRGTKNAVMQPGEEMVFNVNLSDWFDLSQPGTYTIQFSSHVSNRPGAELVKSNILTLTVLPPGETPAPQQ